MSAQLNKDTMHCNTAFLAGVFDCTPRNVCLFVDKGLPTLKRGKAGAEHKFNGPLALRWYLGMRVVERMGKPLPSPLATVLVGIFNGGSMDWGSFTECLDNARRLTTEAGYSGREFDVALDYLLSNQLLRW